MLEIFDQTILDKSIFMNYYHLIYENVIKIHQNK